MDIATFYCYALEEAIRVMVTVRGYVLFVHRYQYLAVWKCYRQTVLVSQRSKVQLRSPRGSTPG